jgi:ribokinase
MSRPPRVAVVGHVEWITHARGAMPAPGSITYLTDPLREPGGGGGVAVAQVARLGADTLFLTAVGDDAAGARTAEVLRGLGVEVRAAVRDVPHTTALSAVGPSGDRAIAVVGEAMSPRADDDLGWDDLAGVDAVYFTGRDPATLAACRRAPVLVAMARRWPVLAATDVAPDVLVGSGLDAPERVPPGALRAAPGAEVWTEGARGGRWRHGDRTGGWEATPPPGPVVDTYGCGDSFAGGLTAALGAGLPLEEAVDLAARCGAWCATGRGGLSVQLAGRLTRSA